MNHSMISFSKKVLFTLLTVITLAGSAGATHATPWEPYFSSYVWNYNSASSEGWRGYNMTHYVRGGRLIVDKVGNSTNGRLGWSSNFVVIMPTHTHKFFNIKYSAMWNGFNPNAQMLLKVDRGDFYDYIPFTLTITSREITKSIELPLDYEQYYVEGLEVVYPSGLYDLHMEIDQTSLSWYPCNNGSCDDSLSK